jgi:phosphoglycolate phosphatase-like HAD superfamily hydrolase
MTNWVFDFDGVLGNTFNPLVDFLTQKYFLNRASAISIVYKYGLKNKPNALLKPIRKLESNKFFEFLKSNYNPEHLLNTELIEVIKQLEGDKYIVTSNYDSVCQYILGENTNLFKSIETFDTWKSKSQALKHLESQYKLDINEAKFVTDTVGDILEFQKYYIPHSNIYATTKGFHSLQTLEYYTASSGNLINNHQTLLTI